MSSLRLLGSAKYTEVDGASPTLPMPLPGESSLRGHVLDSSLTLCQVSPFTGSGGTATATPTPFYSLP